MDPLHVIILAAVVSVVGAVLTRLIERQTAAKLGIPTDTEKKIIDLRAELIDDLEAANKACADALAAETRRREAVEQRLDMIEAQNIRLLRRLGMNPGD